MHVKNINYTVVDCRKSSSTFSASRWYGRLAPNYHSYLACSKLSKFALRVVVEVKCNLRYMSILLLEITIPNFLIHRLICESRFKFTIKIKLFEDIFHVMRMKDGSINLGVFVEIDLLGFIWLRLRNFSKYITHNYTNMY